MKYCFITVEIANRLNNCINKITFRDGKGVTFIYITFVFIAYTFLKKIKKKQI